MKLALTFRLRDLSGSKFSEELKALLGKGVKGECSEKVFTSAAGYDYDYF